MTLFRDRTQVQSAVQAVNTFIATTVKRYSWIIVAVALAVVVGVLWLPFGLRTAGRFEEWDIWGAIAQWRGPFTLPSTRPLTALTNWFAYLLDANSFWRLNFVLVVIV